MHLLACSPGVYVYARYQLHVLLPCYAQTLTWFPSPFNRHTAAFYVHSALPDDLGIQYQTTPRACARTKYKTVCEHVSLVCEPLSVCVHRLQPQKCARGFVDCRRGGSGSG